MSFKCPSVLYKNKLDGDEKLEKAEKNQKQFKSNINEIIS